MEKNQTTKAPEDKLPPVVLRPHALPNGMVIMPTNPENYTKEDLKTLKITAAINVGLMAAVIAAAPYMKSDEAKENLVAKISAVVTDNGGTVDGVDKWGTRKLAYPINYKSEGYYVLVNFTAPATLPSEVERVLRITDGVVRFLVVKK